jgi:hypothetical protein
VAVVCGVVAPGVAASDSAVRVSEAAPVGASTGGDGAAPVFAATLRRAGVGAATVTREQAEAAGAAVASARAAMQAAEAGTEETAARCTTEFVRACNEHAALDARGDELLFEAGRCASRHSPGTAEALWQAVLVRYPRGALVGPTLLQLGAQAEALGMYAAAAERYERYAALLPKEGRARGALQDALALRVGLKQRAAARADWERWLSLFGARAPEEAAAMQMAGWQLARDETERLKLVETYLKVHARHGGRDRVAIAELEAGRLMWTKSCPKSALGGPPGLCLQEWSMAPRWAAGRPGPTTVPRGKDEVCAAHAPWAVTVRARDAKLAATAQVRVARALKLAEGVTPEDPGRARALGEAVATARLLQVDAALERAMATPVARDLDFSPGDAKRREASVRRFEAFYAAMTRQYEEVHRGIEAVFAARAGQPLVAAAGREAALTRTMTALLLGVPLPRGLAGEEVVRVYCDELAAQTERFREMTIAALEVCVTKGAAYSEYGADARACERELLRLEPLKYPGLAEIVPAVGIVGFEPVTEEVVVVAPADVK